MKLFKSKKEKNRAMALFIILIMGSTSVAYSLISGVSPQKTTTSLPNSFILTKPLTQQQEYEILSSGRTIIKFYYTKDCKKCDELLELLDGLVKEAKGQVYLVELLSNTTRIEMYNYAKSEVATEKDTEESIKKKYCNVLLNPPNWCLKYVI